MAERSKGKRLGAIESKDYLDKIINSIGDPIFVKNRQHQFVLVNNAFCALSGSSFEEFIGKTDYDFFPAKQVAVFLERTSWSLRRKKRMLMRKQLLIPWGSIAP